ncbi:Endo-beta-N-acetylglucosaminidase D [Clostridium cavendishii DSM 21758]|uniref:Endo-beta-N-acetylglucosaminidase D n=1 Tax=Clostridium cavendishii DSM 21758 TaxID=1121302 RepID=A0A1M6MQ91_9CLOT|nr:hypothetical protein [Clostridium cavendishii]SHJ85579.1 Endo-beta-N-acetylglucosaminidase D [Clostridium cavendishii DSM 21758]
MNNKKIRNMMSITMALTMTTSIVLSNSINSYASDSLPMQGEKAREKNQPKFSGYRVWDIRDWSPETDVDAQFLRSQIPLQKRNEAFKPTQANPNLNSDAQVMLMQGDYGNAFVDGMMYNNTFGYHTLNFWQYVDYFSPWHGATTAHVPENLYDWQNELKDPNGWQKRYFEFGILNIPNPAYTNAAHKNGVKSVACIYFDQAFRAGQTINEIFIQDKDGKFIVAEKLIEMAKYFGYDGYFFNCEEAPKDRELQKKFLARLTEAGLWTQFYDTNSEMNDSKAQWLKSSIDGKSKRIQNSVFVNYGWPSYVDSNTNYCKTNGVDQFKEVFYGVEANQNKFNGGHSSANVPLLYENGTKNLKGSVALFTPSDFYQRGLDNDLGIQGKSVEGDSKYQWMIAERERMYFSGVLSNPLKTGNIPGASRPEVGVKDSSGWVGVADFASERSVIKGSTFYTNFNTGHGMQYFTNGKVSSDNEWSNINIQDILPTWQWWIDSSKQDNKLKVDFDYGEKYYTEAYKYKKNGGYNGGSSLVVAGSLESENFLRLYKTDLDVKDKSKLSIAYNKSSISDGSEMKVGLILKDNPSKVEYISIPNSGDKTDGWVERELDLSAYKGKKIVTIGLAFNPLKTVVNNYQMNIGEIKITDGKDNTPKSPTGFKVDKALTDDEMIVKWDIADYNSVNKYEVYANLSSGKRVHVGSIYDNILYIKSLENEKDNVTLELIAIGKDGSKSEPAKINYDFKNKVSNIKVEEEKSSTGIITQSKGVGSLSLSWENPKNDYKAVEIQVSILENNDKEVFTKVVDKGTTATQISVPRQQGEKYEVSIKTILNDGSKTEPMKTTGKMKDTFIDSYDTNKVSISGRYAIFQSPDSVDWWKMYVKVNGKVVKFTSRFAGTTNEATRGKNNMKVTLPSNTGTMEIILEDYAGNISKPTTIRF